MWTVPQGGGDIKQNWHGHGVNPTVWVWLLLAESHMTRRLFGAMVGRIAALPVTTEVADAAKLNTAG
jgi:hypothetical protein